ncbi:hypothetical protein pdul_cds_1035 [Pandoravirus dulcis]|uniref:Uncharacterized protein n=1 Tax=Pandoravirus dulcis TaxID=1349409 RepID=S4VSC6_9VIRU|nr:hypothetical protein pdul_cds_1035 [Pandoravirus dulcis]AGO83308.1 hypothetical protein pdul_cds_1035 [Pandoravirus dulcis]
MDSTLDSGAPAIDVLPDEILDYIVVEHVLDPKDLGACLLAWRRFHVVLGSTRLVARRCRYSTVLSLCAASDVEGLRHAVVRPEVFGPTSASGWHACLYAAVAAGHIDVLDLIKASLLGATTALPAAPDGQEEEGPWDYDPQVEALARLSAAASPPAAAPLWPLPSALWLVLAATASRLCRGQALSWLCTEDNRPTTRAITPVDVHSMVSVVQARAPDDAAECLWRRLRMDLGVFMKHAWAVQGMAPAAVRAVVERVKAVIEHAKEANSPDVAVQLYPLLLPNLGLTLYPDAISALFPTGPYVADPEDEWREEEDKARDERLAHEAAADPAGASQEGVGAAWNVTLRGGLAGLRERHGGDAVAKTLRYRYEFFRVLGVIASLPSGLPWPAACDDLAWLCEHTGMFDPSHIFSHLCVSALLATLALLGRADLMAALGDDPRAVGGRPPAVGPPQVGLIYPKVAVAAFGRGDSDVARWACARMRFGGSGAAWDAWRAGDAETARLLYAHGCHRTPSLLGHIRGVPSTEPARSHLYESLCARDTKAVALLLDPTAASASYREAVDRAIADAVTLAAAEALADGNTRVVVWLWRRYGDLVDTVRAAPLALVPRPHLDIRL